MTSPATAGRATGTNMPTSSNRTQSNSQFKEQVVKDQCRPPLRDVNQQPIPSPKKETVQSVSSYSRSTVTLDIPIHIKKVLRSYKFHSVRDLEWQGKLITPDDLRNVIRLPLDECEQVITAASHKFDRSKIRNLFQTLSDEVKENRFQKIVTLCPALDQLLNGGVRIGCLTEFHGHAGCGKTQFCMQLCINVQMPKSQDGLGGEALFVDCESSFSPERLLQMAGAVTDQWYDTPVEPVQMLQCVHFMKCPSAQKLQCVVMHEMENFLTAHSAIRLVVVDGIANLMRYDFESDLKRRTKLLHLIAHQLRFLAQSKHVAVVITNQMTFSLSQEKALPALGKNWASTCSTKIELSREEDADGRFIRFASLVKSQLTTQWDKIRFCITDQGIF